MIGQAVAVRGVVFLALVLLAGCREDPAFQPPDLGASPGEVQLVPRGDLAPNERIAVDVRADATEAITGGVCFMFYRWSPGFGPGPDWVVDGRQDASSRVRDDEVTCPAVGVSLPTSFTFTVPDLEDGTYRITYGWTRAQQDPSGDSPKTGSAEYTFMVG